VSQPDNGEQALEIAETLIRSAAWTSSWWTPSQRLSPRPKLEGDMGDPQMGLQARFDVAGAAQLTGIVSKSRTCLIFINQIAKNWRDVRQPGDHYSGRALKFLRVDARGYPAHQAIRKATRWLVLGRVQKW